MMINREASDKTKGFRLQKLRVIEHMLQAVDTYEKPLIYAAIEHIEDVYVNDRDAGNELLEEDKNYDPTTSFTFNSHEVVNTLVSFIEIWCKYNFSSNLQLAFYSTNSCSGERTSKVIKENSITLPDKPILELLIDKNYDYLNLLDSVKKFVIAEYKSQYSDPKHPGRIDFIEKMNDAQWKFFLSCIDWKFGGLNDKDKKTELLSKIRCCKYFSQSLQGKEEIIFSQLMEIIDERQNLTDLTEKFFHSAEVENIFLKSISDVSSPTYDPVWEIWDKIEKSDSRNIVDKIRAVCINYNQRKIQHYALKVARSLIEQEKLTSDKSILSLKYRIFEHCQGILISFFKEKSGSDQLTESEIDKLIEHLNSEAKALVSSLSSEFRYTHNNEKLIDGLILELFDSCFLAFD